MTVQSSFSYDAVKGRPGGLVDAGNTEKISRTANAVAVPFGKFVARRNAEGDSAEQCGLPTATADVTARGKGFAIYDHTRKNGSGYEASDQVNIMRKGRMWVDCETAWTDGAAVFVRFAVPGATGLGSVRNDADTANAVALPGCVFVGTGGSAGLAMIELNLPA